MDEQRTDRILQLVSFALVVAAVIVGVVAMFADDPDRDSSGSYLAATFLALSAVFLTVWRTQRRRGGSD